MVNDIKIGIDKKFQYIIRNYDIKQLYREYSAPYVYESITKLVSKKTEDWYERWVITRRIFLDYLKKSKAFNKKKNNKEETLFTMMSYLDEDALSYLLSGIDFNLISEDRVLLDELALNVKIPKIMNIIINEVDDRKFYFKNEKRNEYNDLCSMNVLAGNLDRALKIFNREDFYLFNDNINIFDDVEQFENYDCVYRIIKNLVNLNLEKNIRISFLDNILYSDKVTVINVDILDLIKNTCNEDKLKEYKNYFYNKKDIYLYSSKDRERENLCVKNKIKIK